MFSAAYTGSLTAIAVAAGAALAWVFGRFSDPERTALAGRKLRASLYAFLLYGDDPAAIVRAQKQLLIWNVRYLALMWRPAAVSIVPGLVLLTALEAVYGHHPLAPGETALVTAQWERTAGLEAAAAPELIGRGIRVETPAVRVLDRRQAYWRVRAIGAGQGSVLLRVAGESVEKMVEAGAGLRCISERRVSSRVEWLRYPAEAPLPAGVVRWIEVSYPAAAVDMGGFAVNWLVWFLVLSGLTAAALRRRFGGVQRGAGHGSATAHL